MRMQFLSMVAAAALLAACSSKPDTTAVNTNGGQVTSPPRDTGSTVSNGQPAAGSQEDLVANVGDRVFFAYNESSLSSDAQATLERQAAFLKKYPQDRFQVAGNCDERGTREFNLALGERRANAAKNFLIAQGVDAGRLSTISYGKERPSVLGSNESAWAQNRNAIASVQ